MTVEAAVPESTVCKVAIASSVAPGISTFGRQKLKVSHLERLAIVYVRQSDPQQVIRHRESTALQYDLADWAVRLGWPRERVLVIDEDLGVSGRHAEGRQGFQRMLTEVALNHVGIILGRETSRLARSCKDWYHLLEVCGLFGTVLADQDGVFDPTDYHDRLLLGLTGLMSEAELHVMRGRLYAGLMNKARRGELFTHLPTGYVFLPGGEIGFDPDEQVQAVIRLIFTKFDALGSVHGLLRYLAHHDVRLGIRPHGGPNRGQLEWRRPSQNSLRNILHHPLYAGAYAYGRRRADPRRKIPGRPATGRSNVPIESWPVLLKDRHPAFITWEQFEANQQRLKNNRTHAGNLGAPRQGTSLLGGLLICGKCGSRMIVAYAGRRSRLKYVCQRQRDCYGRDRCQSVVGQVLDELVSRQALRALAPAALELSAAAVDDVERERQRLAQQWKLRCERARYEADRAARQYHAVDPENRLVARHLERTWEKLLLELRAVEEEYDRFRQQQPEGLTAADRKLIESLATDIPALWQAPSSAPEDRQVILRHLIDRIVVEVHGQSEFTDVAVHWAGGFVSHHEVVRPVARYDQLRDYDRLVARIGELLQEGWNSKQVAERLNQEGFRPPRRAKRYNGSMVRQIACRNIPQASMAKTALAQDTVPDLAEHEWLLSDLAREVSICETTLYNWLRRGWMTARKLRGRRGFLCVVWADADERDRLRKLHAVPLGRSKERAAPHLTNPKPRPIL
jgi:DNA invertase Pin-like site-specific DNA recombinase